MSTKALTSLVNKGLAQLGDERVREHFAHPCKRLLRCSPVSPFGALLRSLHQPILLVVIGFCADDIRADHQSSGEDFVEDAAGSQLPRLHGSVEALFLELEPFDVPGHIKW